MNNKDCEDKNIHDVLEELKGLFYSNRISTIKSIAENYYSEDEWALIIHLDGSDLFCKLMDKGYCPYCLEELKTESYIESHGGNTESWLNEKFSYLVCPNGHDLDI